jgi:plastocyanin
VAAYYVIGIVLVVWALALTALGLTRDGFPPSRGGARGLIVASLVIVLATVAAVILGSEREHPREEANAEAAEKKAEAKERLAPGGKAGGQEAGAKQAEGGIVPVVEDEYSVKLAGPRTLEAGPYAFEAENDGKIEHDLAVQGPSPRQKTPLIAPGDSAKLEVQLVPGKYKLYCTVPGHEKLGMKTDLTVR